MGTVGAWAGQLFKVPPMKLYELNRTSGSQTPSPSMVRRVTTTGDGEEAAS